MSRTVAVMALTEIEQPAYDGVQFVVRDSGPGFVEFQVAPTLAGEVIDLPALLCVWFTMQRDGELRVAWPDTGVILTNGAAYHDPIWTAWLAYTGDPLAIRVWHDSETTTQWVEPHAALPTGEVLSYGHWIVAQAEPGDPQ